MINGKFSCKMRSDLSMESLAAKWGVMIHWHKFLTAKMGRKWSIDRNLAARWGGVIHWWEVFLFGKDCANDNRLYNNGRWHERWRVDPPSCQPNGPNLTWGFTLHFPHVNPMAQAFTWGFTLHFPHLNPMAWVSLYLRLYPILSSSQHNDAYGHGCLNFLTKGSNEEMWFFAWVGRRVERRMDFKTAKWMKIWIHR